MYILNYFSHATDFVLKILARCTHEKERERERERRLQLLKQEGILDANGVEI